MTRLLRLAFISSALLAPASHADVLVLDNSPSLTSTLVRVQSGTDSHVIVGSAPAFTIAEDIQAAPDGYLYFAIGGASSAVVRSRPDFSDVGIAALIRGVTDISLDASGVLMCVERRTPLHPESGIHELRLDGTHRLIDRIPGFNMIGLDVPHAGPLRDGLVVIGYEEVPPNDYYLYRYRRLPDGRLERDGPLGPIESRPYEDCHRQRGWIQRHVAAQADGLSFLSVEPCSGRVLAHDLEGRYLGPFAVIEDDPTLRDPFDPSRVYDDHVTAVHVTRDGDVYVSTRRRLWHFDSDGALVRMLPVEFEIASALGEAEPIPFEPDSASCRVSGIGYWKRQCLSRDIGFARRPTRSNPRFGQGPGLHPTFQDGRLGELIDRVTRDLEPHGVGACEALWASDPSSWRGKALTRLAALYFDIEDGRLGLDCVASIDGADVTVGAALRRIASLMAEDTTDSLKSAFHVAESIMGGVR